MRLFHWIAALLLFSVSLSGQTAFRNYESALVHPVRIWADGTRLYAVNAPDGRLEVYSLDDPANPVRIRDIPVGLEPVSVTPRTKDEVWVVNNLSDSVSIVSVTAGRVVATLQVSDEPADVAFAGGKAFVSASASDEVHVFDAASLAPLGTIPIFGKDPRALAVSPNGQSLYVLVHRSGNGTTIVPEQLAPAPPPPLNGALPPAPSQGILVEASDPTWSGVVNSNLPDQDIFEIDVTTQQVVGTVSKVGTILFDLAVHPLNGKLYVANTDARNLARFEEAVRSHTIESRVTLVTNRGTPSVSPFDLNPGFTYANFPNVAERALALAEPTGLAIDAVAGRIYVAAQGTDRIGVLDENGSVLARIELGDARASKIDTLNKRGPAALLRLHPTQPLLYVYNRLSLSICDRRHGCEHATLSEHPTWRSIPHAGGTVRDGRKFPIRREARGQRHGVVRVVSHRQ